MTHFIEAKKEQFILNLFNNVPELKERGVPLSFLHENLRFSKCDEDKIDISFFEIRFDTQYDHVLSKCYTYLDSVDVNGDILKSFNRTLHYFETLLKFEIPMNYDHKKFYMEDNQIKSIAELYLCDPWNDNDDGIQIWIYEGYSKRETYKKISEFFDFIFTWYFPEIKAIYNKELSATSIKERKIISALIY